ncbi:unnamed protein product [Phytomonas sp. EM1]|nr:unnamed protein product [Phytomonas sp. EM1]|eukprot:CCW60739.1 unnamed protein product [Phytomonas sp. isolate EM1]
MSLKTLSGHIRLHPEDIDRSSQKLTCTSKNIAEVDINPDALWMLVAGGSKKVQGMARAYLALSAGRKYPNSGAADTAAALPGGKTQQMGGSSSSAAHAAHPPEEPYFNLATAFSLHTVLLSRNHLTQTLGLVQFRNVVRLSLLGNRIRRIEDCEPLGLLSQLAYLSLEFNPVTTVPHYGAHLLRICSFPHPLEDGRCRLRKLDGCAVRMVDITTSALCLQREMVILPELLQRNYLVSFLTHVEKTMRVHAEMRNRGFLIGCLQTNNKLDAIVKHCSKAALCRCGIHETVHATQLLLAKSLRQLKRHKKTALSLDPNDHGVNPPLASALSSSFTIDESVETRTALDGSTISVLDDTTEIVLGDLQWSKDSLRNAEAARVCATCKVCSQEVFRRLISMLDVRLCACLLRIARLLGTSLLSKDVDVLCEMWLSIALSSGETKLADIYAKKMPKVLDDAGPKHESDPRRMNQKDDEERQDKDSSTGKRKALERVPIAEHQPSSSSLASPSDATPPRRRTITKPSVACELFPDNGENEPQEVSSRTSSLQLTEQTLSTASQCASEKQPVGVESPAEEEIIQMDSNMMNTTPDLTGLTSLKACPTPSYPSSDATHLPSILLEGFHSKSTPSARATDESSTGEKARITILTKLHQTGVKTVAFGVWKRALSRRRRLRGFYQRLRARARSLPVQEQVSNPLMIRFVMDCSYSERQRVFFLVWKQRIEEAWRVRMARRRALLRLWRRRAHDLRLCEEMHYAVEMRRIEKAFSVWKRRGVVKSDRRFRECQTRELQAALRHPRGMVSSPANGREAPTRAREGSDPTVPVAIGEKVGLEGRIHDQTTPSERGASPSFRESKEREVHSSSPSAEVGGTPPKPPSTPYVGRALATNDTLADLTVAHPFSEDDVAALVEKASFLLRDREVLIKRLVDQLVECEKARAVSRWYEKKVALLQADLEKRAHREEEARRVRQEYEAELKHLRRCVGELRAERQERLEKLAPC